MEEFPEFKVEKVEFLTNLGVARKAGVMRIPALVCGEKRVTGILLSKGKIRDFLMSL